MNLKILLPYQIFLQRNDVSFISCITNEGSIGILPHRLDCVCALVPAILTYNTSRGEIFYVAHAEGVFIKSAQDAVFSVRHAISGNDLNKLHEVVEQEFINTNDHEKNLRNTLQKMENGFVNRLKEFRNG